MKTEDLHSVLVAKQIAQNEFDFKNGNKISKPLIFKDKEIVNPYYDIHYQKPVEPFIYYGEIFSAWKSEIISNHTNKDK